MCYLKCWSVIVNIWVGVIDVFLPSTPFYSSMPADMTMLADHTARQLLDFSQKLDINLLDNVVNSMYYDVGSQVRVCLCTNKIYNGIHERVHQKFLFPATTGTRSPHQSEGSPRCLDQSWHHIGVLPEHENKGMWALVCNFLNRLNALSKWIMYFATLSCFNLLILM